MENPKDGRRKGRILIRKREEEEDRVVSVKVRIVAGIPRKGCRF
jgi:hypothetical protein